MLERIALPERRSLALVLAVLVFFALGCAEIKPIGPMDEGSGGISPSETPLPPPMFPHPDGWEAPASHGSWANDYGHGDCLKCHKTISAQEEPIPTCSSCHPLFPHKQGWLEERLHGDAFIVKGRAACATECHGFDLNGGLSGVSCNECHTTYPHTTTWAAPGEHGEAAKGDGQDLCESCHGDDLLGGSSGVACNDCHAGYPHTDNWAEPDQHGTHVLQEGQAGCMSQCHGLDLSGGLSGISCDSCHNLYPHAITWEQDHGAEASTLGTDACKGCHGDDFATVLDDQNCFSCHPDYPHPDSAIWQPHTGGHGETVQATYSGSTLECELCHGTDLSELKEGQDCFSCHASYPHDKQSTTIVWSDYEGHGAYTLGLSSMAECQSCHGTEYRGGVRGNASCFSCHVSYPHVQANWSQPQGHGAYAVNNGTTSCATGRCHGVNLTPVPAYTQGPGCDSCHNNYPHPPDWDLGLLHGPVALADIAACKTCHGVGLDVAPPGSQSCQDCHPSYRHHASADTGIPGWETWFGHGLYVLGPVNQGDKSECQLCHGSDYLGGVSNRSCTVCHETYPHEVMVNWPTIGGHGAFIHVDLSDDLTDCKVCHGNNLQGGHSGQSCFECHESYPHNYIQNWGVEHGKFFSTDPNTNSVRYTSNSADADCWNCHGAPIGFTDSTVTNGACTDCHTWTFGHSTIDVPPSQDKGNLPFCNSCHWAYPHISYEFSSQWNNDPSNPIVDVMTEWGPATDPSPTADHFGNIFGHMYYLLRSPLFTDSNDVRPTDFSGQIVDDALQNTCAGSSTGSCHLDVRLSQTQGFTSGTCASVCHQP